MLVVIKCVHLSKLENTQIVMFRQMCSNITTELTTELYIFLIKILDERKNL